MCHRVLALAQCAVLLATVHAQAVTLETDEQKTLYTLGANMARQLARFSIT